MSDHQTNKLQVFQNTIQNLRDLRDFLDISRKNGAIGRDEKIILARIAVILDAHDFQISEANR